MAIVPTVIVGDNAGKAILSCLGYEEADEAVSAGGAGVAGSAVDAPEDTDAWSEDRDKVITKQKDIKLHLMT